MKINWQLLAVGTLTLLAITGVTTHARASGGVSNPQNFEFDLTAGHDSRFQFKSGKQVLMDGAGTAYFTADVDSAGFITGYGTALASGTMPPSGGTPITALVQIQSGSTGGVDPGVGDITLSLSVKVRFTYNGSAACTTSAFSVTASTANWAAASAGGCSTGYNSTTGEYCVYASGFTVPTLPASACGNNGASINSTLSLGTSSATVMQIIQGVVSPAILP